MPARALCIVIMDQACIPGGFVTLWGDGAPAALAPTGTPYLIKHTAKSRTLASAAGCRGGWGVSRFREEGGGGVVVQAMEAMEACRVMQATQASRTRAGGSSSGSGCSTRSCNTRQKGGMAQMKMKSLV